MTDIKNSGYNLILSQWNFFISNERVFLIRIHAVFIFHVVVGDGVGDGAAMRPRARFREIAEKAGNEVRNEILD